LIKSTSQFLAEDEVEPLSESTKDESKSVNTPNKKTAETTSVPATPTPIKQESISLEDDPPVPSLPSEDNDGENKENTSSARKLTKSSSSLKLPPAKSMAEIEKEIAEATANFDKTALSTHRRQKSQKENKETNAKIEKIFAQKQQASIDPNSILRFLRMGLIILLAMFTGYQTAERSRWQAIQEMTTYSSSSSSSSAGVIQVRKKEYI
jgi:hypothetical protein